MVKKGTKQQNILVLLLLQVDISNQNQMSAFKQRLQSLPSVAGIVHTAMVLKDEFIKDLTFESFTEVMGPKIKGKLLEEVERDKHSYIVANVLCLNKTGVTVLKLCYQLKIFCGVDYLIAITCFKSY